MTNKKRNLGWVLTLIIPILLVGGIWWVYHVVQDGNKFSSCLYSVAVENCELKGMQYSGHQNAVNIESALLNTYSCKTGYPNNSDAPKYYNGFPFKESEVKVCQN